MTKTREDILAMPAGLELDMLVGQYVIKFEDYLKENGKRPVVRDGRYGTNYFDLPKYSADISAAWEVVDQMSKNEFPMSLENNHWQGHYNCGFYTDDVTIVQAEAPAAPEAICKSALLAVMEESQ